MSLGTEIYECLRNSFSEQSLAEICNHPAENTQSDIYCGNNVYLSSLKGKFMNAV